MKKSFSMRVPVLLATLGLGALTTSVALSQPPPPGEGGPQRGGFGGGRGGGRPDMGAPRQMTVVQVPIEALTAGLTLTDGEATKIKAIQADVKAQRDALMKPPTDDSTPPDPETMQANRKKLQAIEAKAKSDIEAILTDTQLKALPKFLKELDTLQQAGIPAELYAKLNLTSDQKSQIATIVKDARANAPAPPQGGGSPDGPPPMGDPGQGGRGGGGRGRGPGGPGLDKASRDKVMAVLTADQQKMVKDWMAAHPRPQRGPGGPGGGGRGRGPGGQGGPDDMPPPPGQDGDGALPPPTE